MKIHVLSADALSDRHIARWRTIQANNPQLASPYFCPEFTQLTAAARKGDRGEVCVAVLQADGLQADRPQADGSQTEADIVGFFPFWRAANQRIAHPIAGSLTDFQGLIIAKDCEHRYGLDPESLLRQCDLRQWHFDHLLASQTSFDSYHNCVVPSAAIDVTAGYDAYLASRQQISRSRFKDMARLRRKLTKEMGPLRYEAHINDPKLLDKLLGWKSEQFIRSGFNDLFATPWTRSLISKIHATQTDDFAGMLSALYAGNQLLAAHMGMRSQSVWHYWLPSYDHRFKKFSPGLLLLLSMIEDAANRGMHTIDLGKGTDGYKPLFGNCETLVAEGCVAIPSLTWKLTQTTHQTTQVLRKIARRTKQAVHRCGPKKTLRNG